ncbi:hypothetical protein DFH08DRAFT_828429 [Mycena albidolilacea]|uniref:Uncharacterized protein n=1 Tax=Mycena albidolilacea TaxID=1033008 RepID=A0AAD6YWB9_9AGAR|nr:hypothetical protein DFH08DRAFT_828429 [Mycena albidolilacea]
MCAGLAVASVATRRMAEKFLILDDIFPNKVCAAFAVASVATRYKAEKFLIFDEMSAIKCALHSLSQALRQQIAEKNLILDDMSNTICAAPAVASIATRNGKMCAALTIASPATPLLQHIARQSFFLDLMSSSSNGVVSPPTLAILPIITQTQLDVKFKRERQEAK